MYTRGSGEKDIPKEFVHSTTRAVECSSKNTDLIAKSTDSPSGNYKGLERVENFHHSHSF